jgi:Transposase DDE domain
MDADLDTLCTVVYCTADDLLPEPKGNARRRTTDAEIVTLCVAQAIMGIPSDRRFLRVARNRLSPLFPELPRQAGYFKRRRRLAPLLEWFLVIFARQSPGFTDDLLLIDSTPVECARSRETVLRSALADICDYGYCASHSRYFWGVRLHAIFASDGTPRAFALASPKRDEREVGLELLGRCERAGGEILLSDKGYAGQEFTSAVRGLQATHVRPKRKDEPGEGPHLAPLRQRIESIFSTCKDILTLERHGARTVAGLNERILQRFLCLAACISLNYQLGRPSRALVDYC